MEKDLLHRLESAAPNDQNQKIYSHPLLADLDPAKRKTSKGNR
jgi:hypothetical protein